MIGKVVFRRGKNRVEASLSDRGIWLCEDALIESYLNMLPQAADDGLFNETLERQRICCAAEILRGVPVFLDTEELVASGR